MEKHLKIWSHRHFLRLILGLAPPGPNIPFRKFAKLFNLRTAHLCALLDGKKVISKKLSIQLTRLEKFLLKFGTVVKVESHLDWLGKPNKAFDGQRPIDMLGTVRGNKELDRMIYELESGAFQ